MLTGAFLLKGTKMNIIKSIHNLTRFEWCLWLGSALVVTASYIAVGEGAISLITSLIGVTALIFVAKGDPLGQLLTVVFSLFYAVVSFEYRYYGEMITYLGMSAPMAVFSFISWLKHPYKECEVEVGRLTKAKFALVLVLTVAVTVAFYFVLRALGNNSLLVSTFSVTTSFLAASLLFLRSPFYAAAYAANDVVLIILWIIASISDISFMPMVICFVAFFANDIYALINWHSMQHRQQKDKKAAK